MSNDGYDPVRDVEMRLISEIGGQLKSFGDQFRDFTDKMSTQMLDVRERLTRIEAVSSESSRQVDRLTAEIDKLYAAHSRLKEAQAATVNRVVRMETIIAPLTAIGAALASALVTMVAGKIF